MKPGRREFFKAFASVVVTATPAAHLLNTYGMPDGSDAPKMRHYDPELVTVTWMGLDLNEGMASGDFFFGTNHVALVDRVVGDQRKRLHE